MGMRYFTEIIRAFWGNTALYTTSLQHKIAVRRSTSDTTADRYNNQCNYNVANFCILKPNGKEYKHKIWT